MPKSPEAGSEQVYYRTLPGGGFVAIEVTQSRTLMGRSKYDGELVVERRADQRRRIGHDAPVIARTQAPSIARIFHELFPVAESNVTVATRVLARQPFAPDTAGN